MKNKVGRRGHSKQERQVPWGCILVPSIFLLPLIGFVVVAMGSWLMSLPIVGAIVVVLGAGVVAWGIFAVMVSPQGVEGYGEPH